VTAVVRARGDAWSDAVADRGMHLAVDAGGDAWANATPGALEQIVDNLVDNALSVSQPGGTVTLRVTSDGRRVEVHVIDDGPGLGPDERARAFDRFWRAPDAPAGGSGLGLSIVRRLAEASGGTARLDGAPGGGIDAVVTLVAIRPAAPSSPTARSAGDEAAVPA
jgi:signal transduction histidine kinase